MMPLRVLHLGKYYPPEHGGIETVLETLCRGAAADVSPKALVSNTRAQTVHETRDSVAVTRVARWASVGAVSVTPTLPLRLSREAADVIVLHEPNPMALVAYALARPRAPLVVWFHSEVVRPAWRYRLFYEPFLEIALRRAARIIVAAPPMRDVPALAAHRAKVDVVPYGVDVDAVPTPRPRGAGGTAPAGAVQASTPSILFVGRLVRYKGVEVLVRAMAGVDATLVIVGDGPLRASLESLASEVGVTDRVRFVGRASDEERRRWYDAADVFVLPSVSRQEAFGMVQVEAMLHGLPVVSTALATGVPWVNRHGETGLVVPPGDVEALCGALRQLVGDPDRRAQLGASAWAHARAQFSAQRMCRDFEAVCRAVVAERAYAPGTQPAPVTRA
jgi:glycosyltransferase involved in cell wall biosynthesis